MIRTEKEYQDALTRLQNDLELLNLQREKLTENKLSEDQINLAMEPIISFHEQLKDEVEYYEKIKRGSFDAVTNLSNIGRYLIGLRIFKGMSQAELAAALSVSEAQVSRDERNEYHGVTVEKIQRVLDALGVQMRSEFELFGQKAS